MTMNRKKLVDSFKRYEHWSRKETENGTLLIGNPHKDKPYWWLIHIFPKISPEKIKEFSEHKLKIPSVYMEFLENTSNGLLLFLGTSVSKNSSKDDHSYIFFKVYLFAKYT